MSDALTPTQLELVVTAAWVLPAAAVALVIILWRGWARHDAFRRAPSRRRSGVGPWDWLVVLALTVLGVGCTAGAAMAQARLPETQRVQPTALDIGVGSVFQIIIFGLPPLLVLMFRARWSPSRLRAAGLIPRWPGRDVGVGVLGAVLGAVLTFAAILPGTALVVLLMGDVPQVGHELLEQLLRSRNDPAMLIALGISAVVVAPVVEEIAYRGLMQTSLLRLVGGRRWMAILMASSIFALAHIGAASLHTLPGLLMIGMVFGWLYERTGSLLTPMIAHAAFNAGNLAVTLLVLEAPPHPV